VTLYSQITPEVILQGNEPWTPDTLAKRFEQAFGGAIPRPKSAD
jgi:hypothetical protein